MTARAKRSLQLESESPHARRPRKRDRYTRIACESCKARKVKCSGSLPCSRCNELGTECKYNDYIPQSDAGHAIQRPEWSSRTLPEGPHQDLQQLLSSMRKICDGIQQSAEGLSGSQPQSAGGLGSSPRSNVSLRRRYPSMVDPDVTTKSYATNFVHSLDLAKSVLEEQGVLATSGAHPSAAPAESGSTNTADCAGTATAATEMARPLLEMGYTQAMQHWDAFRNNVYTAYPCINLDIAKERLEAIFKAVQPSHHGEVWESEVDLIDIEITKVVLAIGMAIKDDQHGALDLNLEEQLVWNIDTVMKRDHAQIEDVIMGTLLAIYFFLQDLHVRAWRMTGQAARAALELGMHKANFYRDRDDTPSHIEFLKNLFACISDLEKRCSFFTNLPSNLHDSAVDPEVLNLDGRHRYLSAMISLNSVHSELFELINSGVNNSDARNKQINERLDYLDFRIQGLAEGFPQFDPFPAHAPVASPRDEQIVMVCILQMRTTFMRMLTHFRCLSSATALSSSPRSAQSLIALTKSLVAMYGKMVIAAGREGVNRLWGPIADRYLMGSISCMFLAATYNPTLYGPQCRHTFHNALDLLIVSPYRRAGTTTKPWCSLDDLRIIGEKIEMAPLQDSSPSGMVSDSEISGTGSWGFQPSVSDDATFISYDATEDDYLAILGIAANGPQFTNQMQYIPASMQSTLLQDLPHVWKMTTDPCTAPDAAQGSREDRTANLDLQKELEEALSLETTTMMGTVE